MTMMYLLIISMARMIKRVYRCIGCFFHSLWFRLWVSISLHALKKLDKFMRNKRYNRQDRRIFWRDFTKNINARNDVYDIISKWKGGGL